MKASVSRETFCKAMRELSDFVASQSRCEEYAEELLGYPIGSLSFKHSFSLIDCAAALLEEAMNDEEKLIRDFIYQFPKDGEEFELPLVLRCGKEVSVAYKEIGSLYDYLVFKAVQNGDSEEAQQERIRLCGFYGISCC